MPSSTSCLSGCGRARDPISEAGCCGPSRGDEGSAFARPKDTRSAGSLKEARRLADGQRGFDILKWPTPDGPASGWSVVRLLPFFGNNLHDGSFELTEARLSVSTETWTPSSASTGRPCTPKSIWHGCVRSPARGRRRWCHDRPDDAGARAGVPRFSPHPASRWGPLARRSSSSPGGPIASATPGP